ncbi:hypothetical protein N7466_002152 [Penicillium verhagenii]|uniref:uncharacterized protein n=1 Tax=Penicillium verhagenii TaxID=1562060 RepID=UPI002544D8C3|nr:uncharacterized protein N7466_002152 [Penicillium verhagenii]KAJ5939018.1 hypothetical protein N7466_002152 [Penicillium verhagenii]
MSSFHRQKRESISITRLLGRLAHSNAADISADEIASTFKLLLSHHVSHIQSASFLSLLAYTGKDGQADIIAKCAHYMREAACQIDQSSLHNVVEARGEPKGNYNGGLCDIVGTGGDSHSTFNVSTAASIVASPILMMAKHGSRAHTSSCGSADLLKAIQPIAPKIDAITENNIVEVYKETNYAFLFASNFHPVMAHINPLRKALGIRTIFNLMGPLVNPLEWAIEARVVGVAHQSLGPVFVEVLKEGGARKALVVCGEENLDEISCAGYTNCWRISEHEEMSVQDDGYSTSSEDISQAPVQIDTFQLHPSDFGLSTHPLASVLPGGNSKENAMKLMSILRGEVSRDDPVLEFVLMNVAALLVISGVCESDTPDAEPNGNVITERGPGGGRWKEGLRRARWAVESGQALTCLERFIEVTNRLSSECQGRGSIW